MPQVVDLCLIKWVNITLFHPLTNLPLKHKTRLPSYLHSSIQKKLIIYSRVYLFTLFYNIRIDYLFTYLTTIKSYLWNLGGGSTWMHLSLLTGILFCAVTQVINLLCTPPPHFTSVPASGPTVDIHGPHDEATH